MFGRLFVLGVVPIAFCQDIKDLLALRVTYACYETFNPDDVVEPLAGDDHRPKYRQFQSGGSKAIKKLAKQLGVNLRTLPTIPLSTYRDPRTLERCLADLEYFRDISEKYLENRRKNTWYGLIERPARYSCYSYDAVREKEEECNALR